MDTVAVNHKTRVNPLPPSRKLLYPLINDLINICWKPKAVFFNAVLAYFISKTCKTTFHSNSGFVVLHLELF